MSASSIRSLKIAVLHGSYRDGRFGIRLATKITDVLKNRGHVATLYDAQALKIPILTKPFHHYKTGETVPEWLADLNKAFIASDAFLVVDGEYNYSPTPGLLNFLDHFWKSQFVHKAAAIASYGGSTGGARSAYVLRNTLSEIGLIVAPTVFSTPNIWSAFNEQGEFSDAKAKDGLNSFLTDFEFYATALTDGRKVAAVAPAPASK